MQFIDPSEIFAMQDRARMAEESQRLEQERFFVELTPEQLATFRLMMYNIVAMGDKGLPLAAYYEGVAAQTLILKHNVCAGCGNKHDDGDPRHGASESELEHAAPDGTESLFADPDQASQAFEREPLAETYVDTTKELIGQTGLLPVEVQEKMVEYDLDDLRDEDTGAILGFVCNLCGLKYVSVEDRALRDPGPAGCEGCINKAKWG